MLTVRGIGRDAEDERTLFVIFDRAPTDDEMRAVHAHLRGVDFGATFDDAGGDAGDRPFAPPEAYADDSGGGSRGEPKNYAAQCGMLCGDDRFGLFLALRHGLERPLTPERAAGKVRSLLGVTSRRELNDDATAAARWRALVRDYEQWRVRSDGPQGRPGANSLAPGATNARSRSGGPA